MSLGARVAGCDLDAPDIPHLLGIATDVTDAAAVPAGAAAELGPVSVLVACAGIAFDELDSEEWQRTLDVNLTGTFECVRRVLPAMCAEGYGRVVTLSSMAGIDGGSQACAHYAASKGALIAFTRAVSKEHCHRGITANVVAPRAIRTPLIAGLEADLTAKIPVGRPGEVDDVASLCSAHASYITGEVIVLNGGWW